MNFTTTSPLQSTPSTISTAQESPDQRSLATRTDLHSPTIKVVSSKRSNTPNTESEGRSESSSPIVRSFTDRSSSSETALQDSVSTAHAPSTHPDPLLRSLLAEAKLTKEDLEKETYYIRYDSRQGLFLNPDSDIKTNYLIKRNETKKVAEELLQRYRNQYGDIVGDALEKELQTHFGKITSYSMITTRDLAPATETAEFYGEVLQVPLGSEDPSSFHGRVSSENISLNKHQVVLYKEQGMDGMPQKDIVMLPRHYVYSATPEELEATTIQKTGFVDLQEKQLQKINNSSEEEVLNSLLQGQDWSRVQIKINDKALPYSNGAIELSTLREEVQTLLNKEPSNYELIQILTMLNKEGRVAGLSKGGKTGKMVLAEASTPPSADKSQNETVALSYENGNVVFNYQSQLSKLGYLNVTTPSGNVAYSLRNANNLDRRADLYEMQRFYKATLQLAEQRPDTPDTFKQCIHLQESRQMFYFSKK